MRYSEALTLIIQGNKATDKAIRAPCPSDHQNDLEDQMEAKRDDTGRELRVHQCPWGDVWTGTKEQLMAYGIGASVIFPGENGGPKRELTTLDPRGFKTRINRSYDEGIFDAYIDFPGRTFEYEEPTTDYAKGVKKRESV